MFMTIIKLLYVHSAKMPERNLGSGRNGRNFACEFTYEVDVRVYKSNSGRLTLQPSNSNKLHS